MSTKIVKEHKQFENEKDLINYLIEIGKDEKTINMVKKKISKYGFDLVKDLSFRDTFYKSAKEKVTIYCFTCKKDYNIRPNDFLSRKSIGCRNCADNNRTKPLEQFIEEITPLLGDNYYFILEELIKYYKNAITKVPLYCKIHGKFWIYPNNFLSGGMGCKYCGYERTSKALTKPLDQFIDEIILLLDENYYFIRKELEEYYRGAFIKVPFHCKKHGIFWIAPNCFLKGTKCRKCAEEKRTKSLEQLILDITPFLGENYYIKEELERYYKNNSTKIPIHCKKHGIFWITPLAFLQGQSCAKCRNSKGEKDILKYLTNNKIDFEVQKRFDLCRNKKPLPFDFYLPKYNTCIEYDGEQHYRFIPYWHKNKEGFELQKLKDEIKKKYCKDNNIILIRIRYDENIEEVLDKELKKYII